MIQVITSKGEADLLADFEMELSFENPMFLQDVIPAPSSLNLEFPKTVRNKEIFSFSPRVSCARQEKLPADIYVDGIIVMSGYLSFDQDNGTTIAETFAGAVIPDEIRLMLPEMTGLPTWNFGDVERNLQEFAKVETLMKSAIAGNEVFVLAPFRDTNRKKISNYNHNDGKYLYPNYYNIIENDILLFPNLPNTNIVGEIFPAVKVSELLKAAFPGIDTSVFDGSPLDKIVVISSYFGQYKSGYNIGLNYSNYTYSLPLADRMPAVELDKIVKACLNVCCMSMFPKKGSWVVKRKDDVINGNDFVDWTEIASDDYSVTVEPAKKYSITYTSGGVIDGDLTPEDSKHYYPTVLSMVQDKNDEWRYLVVNNSGHVFKREKGEDGLFTYELVSRWAGQDKKETSDEEESWNVSVDLTPVEMLPGYTCDPRTDGDYYWYTPAVETVNPQNNSDPIERPDKAYIGIYHGVVSYQMLMTNLYYPYISDNGITIDGMNIGISLAPEAMKNGHHKRFATWLDKDRAVVTRDFNLNIVDLKNLDLSKKVMVEGMLFFIKTLTVTVTHEGIRPATVELIEA